MNKAKLTQTRLQRLAGDYFQMANLLDTPEHKRLPAGPRMGITLEYRFGKLYCFGHELACRRIWDKFNRSITKTPIGRIGYSLERQSWFFTTEIDVEADDPVMIAEHLA